MSFLTDDELTTLTDRRQGAARVRVLKKQGIAFKLNGSGQPVVTWESVHTHSGRVPKKQELNYKAMEQMLERYGKNTRNKRPPTSTGVPASRRVLLHPQGR